MKSKFEKLSKYIIIVLLCAALCFQPVFTVYANTEVNTESDADAGIYKYDDDDMDYYLNKLIELYVETSLHDVTREEAVRAMIINLLLDYPEFMPYLANALVTAYDRYGGYYPGETVEQLFSPDGFYGYGILLDGKPMPNGYKYNTTVKRVFDDSPAMYAGLMPGDEIIKIDDINVGNLGLNAVSNLFSSYGSSIEITVRRNGEYKTLTMSKSSVFIPPMYIELNRTEKTALIEITTFLDDILIYEFYNALEYLDHYDYKNIIIDLRGNPGGRIDVMLECLNLLVPDKGVNLCSVLFKDGTPNDIESSGDGFEFEKICVLVNGQSASASEIFTLSLSEITGAVIIGEKSYGKGVGQEIFNLENGAMAFITTFELLSSLGSGYNNNGVEPDIKISPEYIKSIKRPEFAQLNFVNCRTIKENADNKAVLALNQRLASIGYILPEDITGVCTEKTITAVEIFQRYNNLPVGITKIDYLFLDCLNSYVLDYNPGSYQERDVQLECAYVYINQGEEAAREFAAG